MPVLLLFTLRVSAPVDKNSPVVTTLEKKKVPCVTVIIFVAPVVKASDKERVPALVRVRLHANTVPPEVKVEVPLAFEAAMAVNVTAIPAQFNVPEFVKVRVLPVLKASKSVLVPEVTVTVQAHVVVPDFRVTPPRTRAVALLVLLLVSQVPPDKVRVRVAP